MRYFALATDYDGTLAHDGRVDEQTLAALERLRGSGRRLVLVTGRELDDLRTVFSRFDLFDRVVAENGALLFTPQTHEEKVLGEKPPEEFVSRLRHRGVAPISVGRSVVATWRPHEVVVLQTIQELGLELHVIFNKDAVMVLPSGVNKTTGFKVALEEMRLSHHNVVGIGDAENDHAFLTHCGFAAAVANALPMLKQRADLVTEGHHGAGVVELIDRIIATDLSEFEPGLSRHHILLGWREDGAEVRVRPYGESILIAGTSGAGKSTLATGLLERFSENGHQFCIIDPEGDYTTLENAVVLGDAKSPPTSEEVLRVLMPPGQNVAVNMIGIGLSRRPAFFRSLLPYLEEMRAETGRPHWLVLDEAHHLFPTEQGAASLPFAEGFSGLMFITVHPEHVSRKILSLVDLIVAVGRLPGNTIRSFSESLGEDAPRVPAVDLDHGEGLAWRRREGSYPFRFQSEPPRTERIRHYRKYAQGELEPEKSFYFRGPDGKLNLRAQNLMVFLQIGDGIDDDTWLFHLRQRDYSRWLRKALNDQELAGEVEEIEKHPGITAPESRTRMRAAIEQRYTAPA
jgi:HAD superfamily hydrolase (TIGR01484 family)